jgi:CheY-like chemotaxis protein
MNSRRVMLAAILISFLVTVHVFFYQYVAGVITQLSWDRATDTDRARNVRLLLQAPVLIDLAIICGLIAWVAVSGRGLREVNELRDRNAVLRKALEKERSLANVEGRMQAMFEHAPLAMMLFDDEGHLLLANPRAAELLNLERRATAEIVFGDVLAPQAVVRFPELKRALVDQGPQALNISLQQLRGLGFDAKAYLAALPAERTGHPLILAIIDPLQQPEAITKLPVEGGRNVVLVADDEELLRVLMKNMLAQLGYLAVLAKDGQEAIELFAQHREKLAAVILDVVMPRLDGQEAAERIRALSADVPILFCSGFAQVPSDAPSDQKNRLIHKPFSFEDFRLALQTAIERPRGADVNEEPPQDERA